MGWERVRRVLMTRQIYKKEKCYIRWMQHPGASSGCLDGLGWIGYFWVGWKWKC